jgi:hypothetical protein
MMVSFAVSARAELVKPSQAVVEEAGRRATSPPTVALMRISATT